MQNSKRLLKSSKCRSWLDPNALAYASIFPFIKSRKYFNIMCAITSARHIRALQCQFDFMYLWLALTDCPKDRPKLTWCCKHALRFLGDHHPGPRTFLWPRSSINARHCRMSSNLQCHPFRYFLPATHMTLLSAFFSANYAFLIRLSLLCLHRVIVVF